MIDFTPIQTGRFYLLPRIHAYIAYALCIYALPAYMDATENLCSLLTFGLMFGQLK